MPSIAEMQSRIDLAESNIINQRISFLRQEIFRHTGILHPIEVLQDSLEATAIASWIPFTKESYPVEFMWLEGEEVQIKVHIEPDIYYVTSASFNGEYWYKYDIETNTTTYIKDTVTHYQLMASV